MTRIKQLQQLLLLMMLMLPAFVVARPQQELLLDAAQVEQVETQPALNDLSDLSVGINLFPVSNLIAAAANSDPPAPVQFVRVAMNSGL